MFRVGIVKVQDIQNCRVRVVFPDHDQLESWWLPIVMPKTQNDKAYWIPDLGEQVVCLMDERDEDGAVLGAIYSAADLTPVQSADKFHFSFKDGASFEYNRATHALQLSVPSGGSMTITVSGANITIDAGGDVRIAAAGQIQLGGGTLKGVARLGDTVTCPAAQRHDNRREHQRACGLASGATTAEHNLPLLRARKRGLSARTH